MRSFALGILLTCTVGSLGFAQEIRGDTLFVSANYLADRTTGAELVAKFDSAAARTSMLRLDAPIAVIGGRRWLLGDILVTLDINGGGYVARWTVAGPTEVIEAYLTDFRALVRTRHPIYDFGLRSLVVRCACD